MPIELLVPIGIFVVGVAIAHITSAAAMRVVESNKR